MIMRRLAPSVLSTVGIVYRDVSRREITACAMLVSLLKDDCNGSLLVRIKCCFVIAYIDVLKFKRR